MAGEPSNAQLWADADVYVGPTTAVNPANGLTAFGATWDLVGLLDGDVGFAEQRAWDKADHYAWGGILVRTSRRNYKHVMRFTALEDNDAVDDLAYPGSSTTEIVVPRPQFVKIAFEVREATKVFRMITAYRAEVEVDGDIVRKESELTKYPMMATIYPDGDGTLFIPQRTYAIGS